MKINITLNARNRLYLRTNKLFFFNLAELTTKYTGKNSAVNKPYGHRKRDMFKVFHSCMNKNNGGTKHVIEKNCICFWPTSPPYWKRVSDVNFGVRTRSKELKQKKVKLQEFNCYYRFRGCEDIRTWLEADESVVRYSKKNDQFYVIK